MHTKQKQELKQLQMNEHTKLLSDIEDERTRLQEERARNEIAKALHTKNADDTGRSRVEIDAAVKYAEVNIPFFFIFWFSTNDKQVAPSFLLVPYLTPNTCS